MRLMVMLIVVLLASCARVPPVDKANVILNSAVACCTNIAELPFRQLSKGSTLRTKIDQKSPAFHFEEGKRYFLALQLPVQDGTNIIKFSTWQYPRCNAI